MVIYRLYKSNGGIYMKFKTAIKLKRTVSFAAAMAMAVSAVPVMPAYAETGTKSYIYDKYKVDYTVSSE